MKTLKLNEIVGYIPYDTQIEFERKIYPRRKEIKIMTFSDISLFAQSLCNFNIKPLLYPISSLCEKRMHKGKEIIPIMEMAKISNPDVDDEYWETCTVNKCIYGTVEVIDEYGMRCFLLNPKNMYFDRYVDGEGIQGVPNTHLLFDFLHEYKKDCIQDCDNCKYNILNQ